MRRSFILSVSSTAALGGLLFGFDTAIISGAIPQLKAVFELDATSLGWAVGCVLVGCTLGAALAGVSADRFGRKVVLLICAFLFAISGLGAGLSASLTEFAIYRIIGGLGVGACAMVSPMYIAELAPDKERGKLVSYYQLAIMSGILLAYLTSYALEGRSENSWRWMFATQTIPSLLFVILLLRVPETPRWLVLKGRYTSGAEVLTKAGVPHEIADAEIKNIKEDLEQSKSKASSVWHLSYRPVLLAGILLAVFQQITGINAILYYAPFIFRETGLDTGGSILQTIGIGVINVIATFIAINYVDHVGRRKFLLYGSALMGLALLVTAVCFYTQFFRYYIVLMAMLVYVAAFCSTLGAVTWVYLSEIFPNAIRGAALSLATLALWLADLLVASTFPILSDRAGTAGTLLLYAVCCALCWFFVRTFLPETRGRSLEEMFILFAPNKKKL